MGKVGSLGKIKFYVSNTDGMPEVLSFFGMTRDASVKYEEHPVNGKKALLELVAPQPEQLKMTIVAREEFGAAPFKVQKQLRNYMHKGIACTFMLGGRRIGANKWVITNVADNYQTISVNGHVSEIKFAVTLKEYREEKKKAKEKSATYTSETKKSGEIKSVKKEAKKKSYDVYSIKKGDTLWGLADRFYGDGKKYMKIYNANKELISNPNELSIGWQIKIPK